MSALPADGSQRKATSSSAYVLAVTPPKAAGTEVLVGLPPPVTGGRVASVVAIAVSAGLVVVCVGPTVAGGPAIVEGAPPRSVLPRTTTATLSTTSAAVTQRRSQYVRAGRLPLGETIDRRWRVRLIVLRRRAQGEARREPVRSSQDHHGDDRQAEHHDQN